VAVSDSRITGRAAQAAAGIVVSTLLGHQHHLIDLGAGSLLTVMAIAVVPPLVHKWQSGARRVRPLTIEREKTP